MPENIEIKRILKDFHKISGTRVSIHDTEFNEIYSYPEEASEFCRFVQTYKKVFDECKKSDSIAFETVKKTGEVYVYKCNRGMLEAVAPIYHFGNLSGYLMMGQVCTENCESKETMLKRTIEVVHNYEKAEQLLNSVRFIDSDLIGSYINIISVLAEYLTRSNRISTFNNEQLPQLIKKYINKNYSKKITLTILSRKFECCNTTLTKSFKKEYNLSIMTYLSEVRLQKAEEMIMKTRKSLKEISSECGFYDQNYFSKAFAKKYGCTPSEYRKIKLI